MGGGGGSGGDGGGGDALPSLNLSSGPFDAKHLRALLGYVALSSLA